MDVEVKTKQLCDFLAAKDAQGVDFALYVYLCGGTKFVKHETSYSVELDKIFHTYRFSEFYAAKEFSNRLPYFVSYIPGRSYLLYEAGDEVLIWACYTEERFRNNGYIKHLLNDLKERGANKRVVIDTFSETLLRYSRELGFGVFNR